MLRLALTVAFTLFSLFHPGATTPAVKKTPSTSSSASTTRASTTSSTSSAANYCPSGYTQRAVYVTSNFDDIASSPVAGQVTNGQITTPYNYLFYEAFRANNVTVYPPPVGLIRNSGKHLAYETTVTQTQSGTPMLSVIYPMSNVSAFDMIDFYYGCEMTAMNAEAETPLSCTLTITGYRGSSNTVAGSTMVAAQTFQYDPTTLTGAQQLAYAQVFPVFRALQFLTFQYTINDFPALQTLLTGAIDTVRYTAYTCSSA